MTPGSGHPHDSRKISDVLAAILRDAPGERIRLRDLVDALDDRAFGLLILIFALPNAIGLGTIPGVSTIFGLPQIFLAAQMMIGLEQPWLPAWLLDKSLARADFETMMRKASPILARLERVLRPRWPAFTSYLFERVLGGVFLAMAAIVSLPIPFGNQPPAVAMAFIALGLIERDGLAVLAGLVVAIVAVALAAAVVLGGAAAIWLLISHLFGV